MTRALRLWPLLTGTHRYEKVVAMRNRGHGQFIDAPILAYRSRLGLTPTDSGVALIEHPPANERAQPRLVAGAVRRESMGPRSGRRVRMAPVGA